MFLTIWLGCQDAIDLIPISLDYPEYIGKAVVNLDHLG